MPIRPENKAAALRRPGPERPYLHPTKGWRGKGTGPRGTNKRRIKPASMNVIPFTDREQRRRRDAATLAAINRRLDEALAKLADMLRRNERVFDSAKWTGR